MQNSTENSITQVNTTETLDIETNISHPPKSSTKHHHHHHGRSAASKTSTLTSLHATANAVRAKQLAEKQEHHQRANEKRPKTAAKSKHSGTRDRSERLHLSDDINNSCSNITASTYLNGIEISSTSGECGGSNLAEDINRKNSGGSVNSTIIAVDRESMYSGISNDRVSHRSHDLLSESGGNLLALRRESSSTYERDMDIIDLLERERSLDIDDDVKNRERQRHGNNDQRKLQQTKKVSTAAAYMSRPSERRKLPDITKITTLSKLPASVTTTVAPLSPKQRLISTASGSGSSIDHQHHQATNFPNFVFTHQYNEFAEARINRNRFDLNGAIVNKSSTQAVMRSARNNSQTSFSGGGGGGGGNKRNSDAYAWNDEDNTIVSVNRATRARSIDSRKNSTKSNHDDIRGDSGGGSSDNYINSTYANNL